MADGDDELSAADRRFIRQQRLFMVLNNFCWAIQRPGSDQAYMDLCGGDSALMARHYGGVQSMNNFFNMFLNPLVGSLSDAIGRRKLLALGRVGWTAWFLLIGRFRTLGQRRLGELLCWSLLSAGNWTVYGAMSTDVFGDRPSLNARLQSTDQAIGFVAYAAGGLAAEACSRLGAVGTPLAFYIAAACTAVSALLPLTMEETLPPDKRKPFRLSRANPLSNLLLLVRNGPGLRRLSLSTGLFFTTNAACTNPGHLTAAPSLTAAGCAGGTMVPFRMGVLKWTALDISRFGVVVTPIGSLTSQWFVVPWIKKVGNQTAFQVGTVLGCLGWTLCGQCWRLFGVADRSAVLRTGAIYVGLYIANLLGSGWPGAPAACQHSIRAMVLKQGIDVTDAGRGELNAACKSSTPPSCESLSALLPAD